MVVIISSKVRTVAHCNYTCAAISVWKGMWVERCGKYSEKFYILCVWIQVFVWVWVYVCGMCSETEKKGWDLNWCTVCNKTTKQQKNQTTVWYVALFFYYIFVFLPSVKSTLQWHNPTERHCKEKASMLGMIRPTTYYSQFCFLCPAVLSLRLFLTCFSLFAPDSVTCRTRLENTVTQTPLTDKVSPGKRCRQCFLMFLRRCEDTGASEQQNRGQKFIWMILWNCSHSSTQWFSPDLRRINHICILFSESAALSHWVWCKYPGGLLLFFFYFNISVLINNYIK